MLLSRTRKQSSSKIGFAHKRTFVGTFRAGKRIQSPVIDNRKCTAHMGIDLRKAANDVGRSQGQPGAAVLRVVSTLALAPSIACTSRISPSRRTVESNATLRHYRPQLLCLRISPGATGQFRSLESTQTSGVEEPVPAHSSPTSSAEEQPGYRRRATPALSGHVSAVIQLWALSSFSSLEPLHSPSGRLLTLHPEKDQSVIWPSLIVAPVPQELSLSAPIPILVLFAIELLGIRKDREEAFECFVRAWHQAPLPSATVKLVTHYLPPHTSLSHVKEAEENTRGTLSYYVQCIGGAARLGQPYLEAGLLHLEGAAPVVLSASYATLSSIRVPAQPQPENGAEAWQRDRDAASRYFDRARVMNSDLDIPVITDESSGQTRSVHELERTLLDIPHHHSASASAYSDEGSMYSEQERVIR
ncbi:hypothetical protein EDC04DRAFT_2894668 [Pisolithus marmoratus]|nr:hypothetical protein EDC04DRAFT_2894668 [Pisolithus marmoratus]